MFHVFCFPALSESPASLLGKVSQLESIVKLLQDDLKKVKVKDQKAEIRSPMKYMKPEATNKSVSIVKLDLNAFMGNDASFSWHRCF